MESLLTDKQRSDLETSIFGYVSRLTNDEALLSQLAAVLSQPSGSEPVPADTLKANALLLEKKWLSVIRLQRKVMDLETRLEAAEREASSTHKANGLGAGDPKTWLPKTSRFSLLHKQPVNAVSFHPFHSTLASACEDGNIRIWDYELGEIETTIKAHTRGCWTWTLVSRTRERHGTNHMTSHVPTYHTPSPERSWSAARRTSPSEYGTPKTNTQTSKH